ncbi:hypothetical protein [Pseudanabaena sp. 'Roaring Creek']|uniref:hypothetical protein n=1 Tax=Pseudanabaena sp. 'Roaring Creek' TaxID=1681830 RepID=UPI0012E30DB1|nr:hypothetical protein [Pseudanabaena sp. 'Roaring Creek']
MSENRGNRQKQIEAIALPYKCGKIEAEILAMRFLALEKFENYTIVQPQPVRIL